MAEPEVSLSTSEEVQRKRSPVHRRISSCYSNRFMIGLALLLVMVQRAESAVLPMTREKELDLIADILSGAKTAESETRRGPVNETHAPPPITHQYRQYASSGGYDRVYNQHEAWQPFVIKRSDKTMKDYKRFVEKNCRDIDSVDTFLTWEQDQFAAHFKANILAASRRDGEQKASRTEKSEAERAHVRALLELESMCNTHSGQLHDDGKSDELSANDFFENEIVNAVFGNMYSRGLSYADKFRPIFVTRRRNSNGDVAATTPTTHDDEHFEKEIFRTLKR